MAKQGMSPIERLAKGLVKPVAVKQTKTPPVTPTTTPNPFLPPTAVAPSSTALTTGVFTPGLKGSGLTPPGGVTPTSTNINPFSPAYNVPGNKPFVGPTLDPDIQQARNKLREESIKATQTGVPAATVQSIQTGQGDPDRGFLGIWNDATGLTNTGFTNLRNYLTSNVPQAYATAQNEVAPITQNALAQYMASRGVGQQPVQAAVDTANAGLTSSAGNYNQLLNVLRAQEASGQQSRLSEEEMARALAGSTLESTYGAGRANLETEQLAALNQLATQISAARLQAKQIRDARNQALQDALAQLIGQGYTLPTTQTPQTPVTPVVPPTVSPVEQLLQQIAAAQASGSSMGGGGGGFSNPVGNVMQMF